MSDHSSKTIELATERAVAPDAWDRFVTAHPDGHLLQTSDWGRLKSDFGWHSHTVALMDTNGQIAAGAQLLFRRLHRLIPLTVAYIPAGPLFSAQASDPVLWQSIHRAARQHNAAFLKVEPCDWYTPRPGLAERLTAAGFRPNAPTVQPPRNIVIDLAGAEDDILKRMNQSTRYKARLGPKKEVVVRCGTQADLPSFNALMAATGERDSFGVHSPAYYRRAFDLFSSGERCALLLASHQGQDLAGVMAFRHGTQAYYLYGASSNLERNRMPTFIAQWEAIRWAHNRGALCYDLWGVPDADEPALEAQFEQRHDGLWGVYGFKRGWGGRIVRSVGAWDYVYLPPVYALYRRLLKRNQAGD